MAAIAQDIDKSASALQTAGPNMSFGSGPMPIALALWFDDRLFERAKTIAHYLARAEGFTPKHLLGKPEACFAVVERSLTWRLSPYAVAQSTYQTPGGKVGYEGKLCQAILENSGRIEGAVQYIHFWNVTVQAKDGTKLTLRSTDPAIAEIVANGGKILEQRDWSRVQGKFRKQRSEKGTEYPVAAWAEADEAGLGVLVRAQVKGEESPREWPILLVQAFPRNSTLWATDPMTQICYVGVRRFASVAAPGIFMGVPFDGEDMQPIGPDHAIDVTPPRPRRQDFEDGGPVMDAEHEAEPEEVKEEPYAFVTADGEELSFERAEDAAAAFADHLHVALTIGQDALNGLWNSNGLLLTTLRETGSGDLADRLNALYTDLLDSLRKPTIDWPAEAKRWWQTLKACQTLNQLENILKQYGTAMQQCHEQAPAVYDQVMEYVGKRQDALREKDEKAKTEQKGTML